MFANLSMPQDPYGDPRTSPAEVKEKYTDIMEVSQELLTCPTLLTNAVNLMIHHFSKGDMVLKLTVLGAFPIILLYLNRDDRTARTMLKKDYSYCREKEWTSTVLPYELYNHVNTLDKGESGVSYPASRCIKCA